MALQRKYQNETDIPPALREHYTQADDGTWVLDLDGEGQTDVTRLRQAINQEREQRRKAVEELTKLQEQFKDLDPEKAREAMLKLEDLEQERDAGTTGNKGTKVSEEQIAKRFERQIKELNTQIAALQDNVKHGDARYQVLRSRYEDAVVGDRLRAALLEAGADPRKVKFAIQEARPSWRLNDEDDPTPMDEDGNLLYGTDPTKVLTMGEHAKGILKDYPFFALESSGANTQQRGNGAQFGNVIRLTPEQAKDTRTYRAAREQAEKTGATLDIA